MNLKQVGNFDKYKIFDYRINNQLILKQIMEIYSPTLFIEINKSDYIFLVGDENEQGNFILIYKCIVPI